jgi:HAD hydrolase, family IA, variant 1
MYKVILFDLDDTLYLERDYVYSGYRVVASFLEKKYNLSLKTAYLKMIDLSKESYDNVFNRLFDAYNIKVGNDEIKKIIEIYKNHIPNIDLCEDSKKIIEYLLKKEIKLGLITDGDSIQQRNKIKGLDIDKYFEKIIITDELAPNREFWKPNKKAFEIMVDFFKEDPKNILYIGDNLNKDPFGALEVGINFKQILRPGSIRKYKKSKYYFGEKLDSSIIKKSKEKK